MLAVILAVSTLAENFAWGETKMVAAPDENCNSSGDIIEGTLLKGVDVSYHNGTINWEKVKEDGIDGNVGIDFLFGIPGLSALQYDSLTGKYYYYTNGRGRVNTRYTGVAKNEYGWWYVKNGEVIH